MKDISFMDVNNQEFFKLLRNILQKDLEHLKKVLNSNNSFMITSELQNTDISFDKSQSPQRLH